MSVWFVYMIRAANNALYTGISTNVDHRVTEHASGRGSKYLRGRAPLTLEYRRRIGDQRLALAVERGLKSLTKTQKERIVVSAPSRARLLRILGARSPSGSRSS